MPEIVLKVRDLSVGTTVGGLIRPVLKDVSFDLHEREVFGVIGESGAGKTVLSRALVNWISPPLSIISGSVEYHGENLLTKRRDSNRSLSGREIAYIGANPGSALDPTLPVGHQIVEKLRAVEPGITPGEARRRVLSLLDAVRIPSAARRFNEFPFQFSGGMMQRALIVDALVSNPTFLVADNITQPLDVTVAAQIVRLLRELQEDFRTAVIFISSSLGMIQEIADSILVLRAGRAVEQETKRQLFTQPRDEYTKQLIADAPRIWSGEGRALEVASTNDPILTVSDIAKTYHVRERDSLFRFRDVQAVRGVSFNVLHGENFGIVGESGCGKSTLSRLLSRLEAPDRGQILFKGQDINRMSGRQLLAVRRAFQLLLQDPFNSIPPHLYIGRTIAEPLRIHGGYGLREIQQRVHAIMAEVGLSDALYHSLPVGLSAGQRQRVNIARAMILNPELLILDETLSALDQVEQKKLLGLFERLQVRYNVTYIFISHDLSMVRRVCNRVAVMYLGRVVELANNQAIFFDPSHPYTRALLSAVPTIEERPYSTATYLLEGEPPDPINIPPGCSFRTRCPFAFGRCQREDPISLRRSPQNEVACHLADSSTPANVPRMPYAFPRPHDITELPTAVGCRS